MTEPRLWLLLALLMFSRACCARPPSNLRVHTAADAAQTAGSDDHHYARPSGADVSGFPPPNSAANHRSPCPALNSLANHGYLPRDGKNLTPELIRNAIVDVFNVDETLAERLTRPLPQQLTLADLSVHGFIEHDASLVHDDTYFKGTQRTLTPCWRTLCSLEVRRESWINIPWRRRGGSERRSVNMITRSTLCP